jgi:hypothetical protein
VCLLADKDAPFQPNLRLRPFLMLRPMIQFQPLHRWMEKASPGLLLTSSSFQLFRWCLPSCYLLCRWWCKGRSVTLPEYSDSS